MRVISLQQTICGRTYKKSTCMMENYDSIEYMLVVRRQEYTMSDRLGYAFASPIPLMRLNLPGFDFFVRYYDNLNSIYGKKLQDIAARHDVDIIHTHGAPDDLGFIAKKYTDKPIIHEVFDTVSLYDRSIYGSWIKGKVIEKVGIRTRLRKRLLQKALMWEKYTHENADGIVYTSEYMLNAVKRIYNCPKSIVIPNAVLRKNIPVTKLPKLREIDGEINTVYVGAIGAGRNHRNILPLLRKIANEQIHVHIYGIFTNSIKFELNNISRKNRYFHLHDPLPYSKLYVELTQYDYGLVLLAPFNEKLLNVAIPNKLYEYLVSDLPVIVSPYDSLVDFVTKRKCGFVLQDVDDIHSQIGKKYYIGEKSEYTMEHHIPKLMRLYESVVN